VLGKGKPQAELRLQHQELIKEHGKGESAKSIRGEDAREYDVGCKTEPKDPA